MRVFSRLAARKSESFRLVGKAEGVGFEPTEAFTSLVFKTESWISPYLVSEGVQEVFCRVSAERLLPGCGVRFRAERRDTASRGERHDSEHHREYCDEFRQK
jgi:hypothetical protein